MLLALQEEDFAELVYMKRRAFYETDIFMGFRSCDGSVRRRFNAIHSRRC
jgi:hypothetical protein